MMADDTALWTINVSRKTDVTVRDHLAARGAKQGDLSKFIEDAVKWRVLDQTIADTRDKFADMSGEEIDALVDEALTSARRTV